MTLVARRSDEQAHEPDVLGPAPRWTSPTTRWWWTTRAHSPVATIRGSLLSGRGGSGLGKPWNGAGITSSTAAQVNRTAADSRSVGYAENALLPLGAYSSFRGQAVDLTSVLIAYTRTADANLDGIVNNDDVTVVGANFAPGAAKPAWALGDFEYDGSVDNDDVTLLGVFYNPAATRAVGLRRSRPSWPPIPRRSRGLPPTMLWHGLLLWHGLPTVPRPKVSAFQVKGDLRSSECAGSGDPRQQIDDDTLVDLLARSIAAGAKRRPMPGSPRGPAAATTTCGPVRYGPTGLELCVRKSCGCKCDVAP